MTMTPERCGKLLLAGLVGLPLASFPLASKAQPALPFDPVPSAFQRWLNSQRDWPNNQRLEFSALSQCLDQTARQSPYRMPVYTCLGGTVRKSGGGEPSQLCELQRVSYFPTIQRKRLWTARCRSAS